MRLSVLRDEVCGVMELGDPGALGCLQGIQSRWKGNEERGKVSRDPVMPSWECGGGPRAVARHR